MSKKDINLIDKQNEELCILIAKLKFEIIKHRFDIANGQEKGDTHKISKIKKIIANGMTILKQRGYAVSIGNHGICMIDIKTNKAKYLTDKFSTEFADKIDIKKIEKNNDNTDIEKNSFPQIPGTHSTMQKDKNINAIKAAKTTREKKKVYKASVGAGG